MNRSTSQSDRRWGALWREYWFEIIWVIIVLTGVFLLVERMNIRMMLWRWTTALLRTIFTGVLRVEGRVAAFILNTTLSDLVGMGLIALAIVAMLLRLRWRLMRSERLTALVCPVCGGPLHRIHRRPVDRLISLFVPVRRYRCRNRDCRWTGLRVVPPSHGS
ncbi:MAG: hypothetical protein J7M34_10275 [Anaerolineae bacterium]|nr:hypothetical protein [Anaerolineae bacterium]